MSKETTAQRNIGLDAKSPSYDGGYQRQYNGTRPANANTALSGNTLLVELRYGSPAFGPASGGVATANAITQGVAVAAGTPTFVRNFESDGTTVVDDMSIGLSGSGSEVIYDKAGGAYAVSDVVQCSACTRTAPIGS